MLCRDVEAGITSYLDGDLDAPAASAFRGHLRECAACRGLAEDHARLAGALANLPPADPPAALWDGVRARLAEAEKADSHRPRWRLTAASAWDWLRAHVVPVAAVAAAVVVAVVWFAKPREDATVVAYQPVHNYVPAEPPHEVKIPGVVDQTDVTVALTAEAKRIDSLYASTVEELLLDVGEEKTDWSLSRRRAFDAELSRLQAAVNSIPASRIEFRGEDPFDAAEQATAQREHREAAWQRLVAYLQRAAIGELEEARR